MAPLTGRHPVGAPLSAQHLPCDDPPRSLPRRDRRRHPVQLPTDPRPRKPRRELVLAPPPGLPRGHLSSGQPAHAFEVGRFWRPKCHGHKFGCNLPRGRRHLSRLSGPVPGPGPLIDRPRVTVGGVLGHVTPEEEFAEFAQASSARLRRTAFLLCGDWHLAEDLAQTALAKVFCSWRKISRRDAVQAYAMRTLLNSYLAD